MRNHTGKANPFYGKEHSEQSKRKMSLARMGKHPTEKTRRKMSLARKGKKQIGGVKYHSKETKRKMSTSQTGRKHLEETKKKISKAHRGYKNPMYGKHLSKSTKKKMSAKTKGVPKPESFCIKISKAQKKLWQNPTHKRKQIKAMCDGIKRAVPTKPERKLRKGLNILFPNQYKFTGDGSFIIGFKKPDFVNVTQNKIIEMFGDYWHSKNVTENTKAQEENQRIRHFAKYGYKTLIVWERELKNIPKLKRKLKVFHEIR